MVGAAAALFPGAAVGDALRTKALRRWIDLRPLTVTTGAAPFELLEERRWVEALRDPARWSGMTGVDEDGRYEAAFQQAYVRIARQSRVVVDAGAARGLYTLLAAAAGARVHALEPDAGRRFALRLNVLRAGLGERVTIRRALLGRANDGGAVSLDGYCRRNSLAPDFIKMDIEGAEIAALEGAREVCLEHRPTLLIEFHQRRLRKQGRDPAKLLLLLKEYGYQVRFNGHHGALEQGRRAPDMEWRPEAPNENLTAVWATPLSRDRQGAVGGEKGP